MPYERKVKSKNAGFAGRKLTKKAEQYQVGKKE